MIKSLFLGLLFCAFSFSAVAQDCPRIFQRGDTLYTDPAPQYQWFKDQNPIPNATNQWYLPPVKGNYAVQISGTTFPFPFNPQTSQKTITGRIIDERYEPIADATITFGKISVKSDAKGWFSLKNLMITGENAIVTITKAGFWKNVQRVHFFNQNEAPLTAMLEPLKVTNRFDATKGATISERGFFLTFPPNAVINESGQTYQGTVHLSLKRSFPSEDGFGLRMPGGDFSAIDANGQEKMLISYGFMSAEMQGANGEKLRLAPNQEATLEFYIPWEQNNTAPDSMPLWHFDETNGIWRPEGTARKVGPRYVGTVKHFSSWNCDVPSERATVKGIMRNCKGTLIPNVIISVGQRSATTNSNGEYTSYVPSDTEFEITASLDTVSVTPLVEAEEREVKDLEGSAVVGAIGLIDTARILTVYGDRVETYSVDSGKTFHPKNRKLRLTQNEPIQGIVRDTMGCESKFQVWVIPKLGDCQILDSATLAQNPTFWNITNALASERIVYKLDFLNSMGSINDIGFIARAFPCLHSLKSRLETGINFESFIRLSALQELNLQFTNLSNFPEPLIQLTNLQKLKLYRTLIFYLPESFGQLSGLQILDLDFNDLLTLPESFGQLTNLKELILSSNHLRSLPESLGQLKNLRSLNLVNNPLKDLPESFGELNNLQMLNLGFNQFKSLPESIGQLSNLQSIDLMNNQITNLPESIGQLVNLQSMGLRNNLITTLPQSIGRLQKIEYLEINGNRLTDLPESIGQLANLQSLILNGNQISGLPESIGQLSKLRDLNLGRNQLTALPESIANLKDTLSILNLEGNPIPEEEKARIRSWLPNTYITF